MSEASYDRAVGIIRDWWRREVGDRQSSAARALAARLRRATAIEALSEPAIHRLAERLETKDPVRLHRLAVVLARVRSDAGGPLPRRLGAVRREGDSGQRLQRLMRAEGDELTEALIRALPLIENSCDVGRLGADLWHWTDRTRARWTFDYFGATAPASLEESSE